MALARVLGLERVPSVLVVDAEQSPALLAGPGEPVLVLPKALLAQLDVDELDTVLLHELAHLHRKDGLVRWLELAACALFWWNPAVWWTRRRLRDAEEACCDEVVLRHLPRHASAYASALVKTLALRHDRVLPATVSTMTSVRRMEERLEMILHGSSSRPRPWLTTMVGVLSLAVVGVFPTFSQEDPQAQLIRQDEIEAQFEERRVLLEEIRSEAERNELDERRIERENRERRTIRERTREPRGEREVRVEREVELRQAEIALRRADVDDRRREVEIVRRERQTRTISAQARRDLDRRRVQREVDRERLHRKYEGLRREYAGRYVEAQVLAQVEVLREILRRLDDDGAASRYLAELESSIEELLERRADEADRQEGSP